MADRHVHDVPSGINVEPAPEWGPAQSSPGHGYEHSVTTEITLPTSLHTLFVLSRGPGGGTVNLTADSTSSSSEIKASVTVYYNDQSVLQDINIKKVTKEDGQGIGVFTPRNWHVHHPPLIEVLVPLPGSPKSPLHIPNFETDLLNFNVNFGDLRSAVSLDSVSVNTANGNVDAKTLLAKQLNITSKNGIISGSYASTSVIELTTSNGRVPANVSLESSNADSTLQLKAISSNGDVTPQISLSSAAGTGGKFNITAKTSMGSANITFAAAPVDSTTNIVVATQNGNAAATLHPTFEGTIAGSVSMGTLSLHRTGATDPSGKGRQREVKVNQTSRHLDGTVYWSPADRKNPAGSVTVSTSMGTTSLTV